MKKRFKLIFTLCILTIMALTACSSPAAENTTSAADVALAEAEAAKAEAEAAKAEAEAAKAEAEAAKAAAEAEAKAEVIEPTVVVEPTALPEPTAIVEPTVAPEPTAVVEESAEDGAMVEMTPVADRPAFLLYDTDIYYRLTSMFAETDNRCWESGPGWDENAFLGGVSYMETCQDMSGQLWKFTPAEDGYYFLTSQFKEGELRLESGDGENSPTYLDAPQDVTGQFWKIVESAEDGYLQLTSAYMESENRCLESGPGPDDGYPFGGAANMAPCEQVSGQLWRIDPVNAVANAEVSELEVLQQLCDDTGPADTANGYSIGIRFVNLSGGAVDVAWRDGSQAAEGEYESWITVADEDIFDNGENWPGVDFKFSYANGQEYSWITGDTPTQCIILVDDEVAAFAVPITPDGAGSVVLAPEYALAAGGSTAATEETTQAAAPTAVPATTTNTNTAQAAVDSATYCSDFGPIPAGRDARMRIVNLTSSEIPIAITNADDDGITDQLLEANKTDQMWNTFEGKTAKFELPSGPYTHTARNGDCIFLTDEGVTVVPAGVTAKVEAKSAAVAEACQNIYEQNRANAPVTVGIANLTASPIEYARQSIQDGQMGSPSSLKPDSNYALGIQWRTLDGYKTELTLPSGKYTQTASHGNCLVFNKDGSITTLTTTKAVVPTDAQLCESILPPDAGFSVRVRLANMTSSAISTDWKGNGNASFDPIFEINPYWMTARMDTNPGDVIKLNLPSGSFEYTVGNSTGCVVIRDSGATVVK